MLKKENKGRISKWCAVSSMLDNCYFRIIGDLDGVRICISPVLNIIGDVAETENSFYNLGAPAVSEYQFDFPADGIGIHE